MYLWEESPRVQQDKFGQACAFARGWKCTLRDREVDNVEALSVWEGCCLAGTKGVAGTESVTHAGDNCLCKFPEYLSGLQATGIWLCLSSRCYLPELYWWTPQSRIQCPKNPSVSHSGWMGERDLMTSCYLRRTLDLGLCRDLRAHSLSNRSIRQAPWYPCSLLPGLNLLSQTWEDELCQLSGAATIELGSPAAASEWEAGPGACWEVLGDHNSGPQT